MSKYLLEKFSGENLRLKLASSFLNLSIIPENKQEVMDNPDLFENSDWEMAYFGDPGEYEQAYKERSEAIAEFIAKNLQPEVEILFAVYKEITVEGHAFVLYRKDGVLYEVNGWHCSCHGLENQWEPEETTLEAIEHRLTKGSLGYESSHGSEDRVFEDDPEEWQTIRESGNVFATELLEFINEYRGKL